jgi:hypothetical protein
MLGSTKAAGAPPSWRFHSSGFATGSNAEMAVVGRPPPPASMTTPTTTAPLLLAPPLPGDHHRGGGGGGTNNKRPLASCLEELEWGWQQQRHRFVSNDQEASSYPRRDDDEDEIIPDEDDDCDLDLGGEMMPGGGDGGAKRRRMDATAETMTDGPSHPSPATPPRRAAVVRIARRDTRRQVKPGWYEGPLDAFGNRHGRGATRHDDGTTYEGGYENDVMSGPGGRYTFAARRELVAVGPPAETPAATLLRRTEVRFEGSFRDDAPSGAGTTTTSVVDRAFVAGRDGGRAGEVRRAEVVHDVGVHDPSRGTAVGEGARVAYRRRLLPGTGPSWERSCRRLVNGLDAGVGVPDAYAAWIVQCMGAEFPGTPPPLAPTPSPDDDVFDHRATTTMRGRRAGGWDGH